MSKSYPEDLWSYLVSRLITVPMLMLFLLLLLAAWLPSFPNHVTTAAIQVLTAANLLAMFRLWDDLSDISKDRNTKPDRVLCQTAHLASFRWTCGILGVTAMSTLMLTNPKSGVGFIILTALFIIYYKLPGRSSWPRLSYHLLIFKYPCFIAFVSVYPDEANSHLHFMMMFLTYIVVCIYEVAHDAKLRADAWCRVIATIELITAAITVICITSSLQ